MTMPLDKIVFTALLGAALALSGMAGKADAQAVVQPPEQAAKPVNPEETEEEKEKKKKKKKMQQQQQQRQEKAVEARQQEQQMALYRKNIALREELAERDAQILRQQKRIQHLRFQEQYEERLRAQRVQLERSRYDYSNDPYYYTAPNYQYRRDGRQYQTNQYGIRKLEKALEAGYNEGFRAGRADRQDGWRYDYREAFAYKDANYGYDGRYIEQDEYNHYFREGFERGYEDGYYDRQKYGKKKDSGGINDEWLIGGAVVAAIIGYQLLTD